jgi:8-hydroxy-5-deazaflavin:NADPH oxidoreductase
VAAAFRHVSAVLLDDPQASNMDMDMDMDMDVLVLGDDREAMHLVCALTSAIPGVRGIYAGRLRNAGQVAARTANLIAINKRYHTHAGVGITSL